MRLLIGEHWEGGAGMEGTRGAFGRMHEIWEGRVEHGNGGGTWEGNICCKEGRRVQMLTQMALQKACSIIGSIVVLCMLL